MEKIRNKILILIPFILLSCMNSTDKIIRKVCTELTYHENKISIISYLTVNEQTVKGDYSIYTIDLNVYQEKDSVIKYTEYFKSNGVYIFVNQKNKPHRTISKEIQEEIYNWGGKIKLESPQYTLILDHTKYKYKLINEYENLLFPYDSVTSLNTKELELMIRD